MKKILNTATVLAFCAIIFTVPIMTKVEKPVMYSVFENRNMAEPPVFNTKELLNGSYLPLWDAYFSDHIWKRNDFLKSYVKINSNLFHKDVVNKVVIQDDLLLPFVEYSDKAYDFSKPLDQTMNN